MRVLWFYHQLKESNMQAKNSKPISNKNSAGTGKPGAKSRRCQYRPGNRRAPGKYDHLKPHHVQFVALNARLEQAVRAFVFGQITPTCTVYTQPGEAAEAVYNRDTHLVKVAEYSNPLELAVLHAQQNTACAVLGLKASRILEVLANLTPTNPDESSVLCFGEVRDTQHRVGIQDVFSPISAVYEACRVVLREVV